MKILIAEDELHMQKIVGMYLEREGFEVSKVNNGEEALCALEKESFDLAILDWMMPKVDGLQVALHIQKYYPSIKIMMLTAKGEIEDEIMGLSQGAHDYLRKPFEPRILLLRVKKLLGVVQELKCEKLCLSLERKKVTVGEVEIKLSKKEYELLEYLLRNQGIILSRDILLDRVWGSDYIGEDRTVDTHIRRLRQKIGEEFVQTHRGLGYSLEKQHE